MDDRLQAQTHVRERGRVLVARLVWVFEPAPARGHPTVLVRAEQPERQLRVAAEVAAVAHALVEHAVEEEVVLEVAAEAEIAVKVERRLRAGPPGNRRVGPLARLVETALRFFGGRQLVVVLAVLLFLFFFFLLFFDRVEGQPFGLGRAELGVFLFLTPIVVVLAQLFFFGARFFAALLDARLFLLALRGLGAHRRGERPGGEHEDRGHETAGPRASPRFELRRPVHSVTRFLRSMFGVTISVGLRPAPGAITCLRGGQSGRSGRHRPGLRV